MSTSNRGAVSIRELTSPDIPWAESLCERALGGRLQARLGELVDVLSLPGLVAESDGRPTAFLTFMEEGESVELVAICSELRGSGRALIAALKERFSGSQIWLVTTNDNLRALRSYQLQGFELIELRRGAVEAARKLKPSIPMIGEEGIPMRDELILRYDPSTKDPKSAQAQPSM